MRHIVSVVILLFLSQVGIAQEKCISGSCENGYGVKDYGGETIYTGNFIQGKREGKAKMTWKDGSYYEGNFVDDMFEGEGTFYDEATKIKSTKKYIRGIAYTWTAADGKKKGCVSGNCTNGYGTYVYDDGTTYVGEWANGLKNGKGITTLPDKSTFTGMHRNGYLHGNNIYFKDINGTNGYYTYYKGNYVTYPVDSVSKEGITYFYKELDAINVIIDNFYNNFELLKISNNDDHYWQSKIKTIHSTTASIGRNYIDSNRYNVEITFLATKDKSKALEKFNEIKNTIAKEGVNAGSFTIEEKKDSKGEAYIINYNCMSLTYGYAPKYRKLKFYIAMTVINNEYWVSAMINP